MKRPTVILATSQQIESKATNLKTSPSLVSPNMLIHQRNKTNIQISLHSDAEPTNLNIALPFTGIDYPFIKRRPYFIKDAPAFEPIYMNRQNLGQRLLN